VACCEVLAVCRRGGALQNRVEKLLTRDCPGGGRQKAGPQPRVSAARD